MKKVDLSTFNNSWWKPGSKLKILAWVCINPLTVNSYIPLPQFIKKGILKLFGTKIANGVVIKQKVNIKYPWLLQIGENAWIGENVWIDNLAFTAIGANACLSQGAMLLTGNHDFTKTSFDLMLGEITIAEGAWVCAKSIVGPGVKMGSHSVLGVNSFTSKDLEPYTIYSGNPAKAVKMRQIQ